MQEAEVERRKEEDDAHVGREALPDVAAKEREIQRDDNTHHCNHEQPDGSGPPHQVTLDLLVEELCKRTRTRLRRTARLVSRLLTARRCYAFVGRSHSARSAVHSSSTCRCTCASRSACSGSSKCANRFWLRRNSSIGCGSAGS